MDREERTIDNFKPKKKYAPVEVADDALERVSSGTDNYAVIPNRTDTGNVAAITEA